ncbi:SDR family NAD(P)-dependent oxidoreductase [Zoogloea sp.]|uniref:SDR family NAD(P)-dependent oxidoreductase n=1 Tax=Zoogloea sp. TaxID=49181 RepID=UPI0035B17BD8
MNKTNKKIAVVGYAFRFPGDMGEAAGLWEALCEGRDLVTQVDPKRWATAELSHPRRAEPGRSITFSAGVLSRIDEFDAEFFGISPREAAVLDPQQRLLLELTWECFEHAALPPSRLAGSDCAVYVGVSGFDYALRGMDDLAVITPHSMTGNTLSITANRLSYVFDLHGPSLAVDTACSSSLVALHHACNALRHGEASTALVGGVNLLLHPQPFIGFTKASMLSADGRCKPFDAEGNGYVRAEGGAVLLLKPLEQAQADGDCIHGVILASGVNTDGARKTGLTIPSAEAQAALMRSVLARSGLSAADVDFVEAHGTGTSVGDPIEAAAIGAVYGQARPTPLPIGSIKANVGHMESAAGMAGLIKTLLVLRHRSLPPALHLNTPNPRIDFQGLNLELVRSPRSLSKPEGKPLVAGLNSFGFGGANAHVLLQEFIPENGVSARPEHLPCPPLFLSARGVPALQAMALEYARRLKGISAEAYYAMAHGAALGRERLERRLAVCAENPAQIAEALAVWAEGGESSGIVREDALPQAGGLAFVYAGNGAQWHGMGCRLLAESPRFAQILSDLDARMQPLAGFSVLAELQAAAPDARLNDTSVAQPLLFAIQVGLTLLLRDLGVRPQAVAGHSVGEIAAAWAAGVLDLDQAVRLIVARSQAQGQTRGQGRMAVVGLAEAELFPLLAELNVENVVVAGVNSPDNLTLSGPLMALEQIGAALKARHKFFRLLDLDYAFHSPYMEPVRGRLARDLAGLHPGPAHEAQFVSTVTGALLEGEALDADYWWRNVREPVQFARAMTSLVEQGCRVFVEISPHAILQRYIRDNLDAVGVQGRVLPSSRQQGEGLTRVREVALRVQLLEAHPDLGSHFPLPARPCVLPSYPWQKEAHWHGRTRESLRAIERRRVHPLLGWPLPEAPHVWENVLDSQIVPWLADHQVGGAVVFPGAGYLELALAAGRQWLGEGVLAVEELDILAPLVFDGEQSRSLRFEINDRDGSFRILARPRLSDEAWTLHAAGRLLGGLAGVPVLGIPAISPTGVQYSSQDHYALTERLGLGYGPAFQGLDRVWVEQDCLEAWLRCPAHLALTAYHLHPALLDVCYQSLVDFFRDQIRTGYGVAFLPVKTGRLTWHQGGALHAFRARLRKRGTRSVVMDLELFDEAGVLLASLSGCRLRAAPLLSKTREQVSRWWLAPRPAPHPDTLAQREMPAPIHLLEYLQATQQPTSGRQAWFAEAFPLQEALVLSLAWESLQALERAHGFVYLQQSYQTDPYLAWMLDLLAQEGVLQQGPEGWRWVEDAELPPAIDIWQTLMSEHPECHRQLLQLGRVGLHLPELLAPGAERGAFLAQLRAAAVSGAAHTQDPPYAGIHQAVLMALEHMLDALPPGQQLRVLEICGPDIRPDARWALGRLEGRVLHVQACLNGAGSVPEGDHVAHGVSLAAQLDEQGAVVPDERLPEAYDVLLVHHALHHASQPVSLLARWRQRLVPGGLLLLAERHPDWSADLLAGLAPGWWHPLPKGGHASSLVPPQAWHGVLDQAGFESPTLFEEPAAAGLAVGAYLLWAKPQAPGATTASAGPVQTWRLLADAASRPEAQALAAHLRALGQQVWVCLGAAEDQNLTGCEPHAQHLIYMRDWGSDPQHMAPAVAALTAQIQDLTRGARGAAPRLWVVARGAFAGAETQPVAAALWGLGRVVMNEHPELCTTLVDVAPSLPASHIPRLLEDELLRPDGCTEVLLSPAGRHTLRMEAVPAHPMQGADTSDTSNIPDTPFRLDFHLAGQLRNLVWLPLERRQPGPHELEISVRATGLNFRDVMYLMGLLPDEAVENGFAGASLGLEFSGVVTRVGPQVHHLKVGDAVMGFGASCFASHVLTRADAVAVLPEGWSHTAAATVPTVFFTVYYALRHLADVQAGERVLIHGGAGGVGIAAIQLARHLGAEVFATAGSDEKRDFVRLLGADRVFDSRSLVFADEVLAATGGEGVDVVLNSLAGEAMRRNLQILKPFGRFLELGKRDFFENTPVGLRPFKSNISYFGIDADQLLTGRPALAGKLFREVMALFHEGVLSPLPSRVFPASQVVDAFRAMQQARHIGKIVVSLEHARPALDVGATQSLPSTLGPGQTWLVTGGLAGFGLQVARWLADAGVDHLVLLGRRGLETPGAREAVAALIQRGVKVEAHGCDVTDAQDLHQRVARLSTYLPPLTGVVHAAAVFDDAIVQKLDAERIARVMAPKALGAWNLHQATLGLPLKHFVLFSSVTTAIGNPGQGNYVAANMALEALAQLRQAAGLPALCVGWGPIGDAGYLTRNTAVRDSLEQRLGKAPLGAAQALEQLGQLLAQPGQPPVVVANLDWSVLSRLLASSGSERFAWLNSHLESSERNADEQDFRAQLEGKSPAEAEALVRQLVAREVARILAIQVDRIDPQRPLHDLGLDSLMAVELALGLEQRLGIQLPVMLLNESPSLCKISQRILEKLQTEPGPAESTAPAVDEVLETIARQHGEAMSEDDRAQIALRARSLAETAGVRLD